MAAQPLISVEEALARITAALRPAGTEMVGIAHAHGRVLARAVASNRTQPPFAVSAMDGYAVRAHDVAAVPARLTVIGQAPAGAAFAGMVGPGQAVRIFTGGPVPHGADTIIIQEDTSVAGDQVTIRESAAAGRHIRPEGLDFRAGDVMLTPGRRLGARDVALAAAMNVPWLKVARRPRIALLATGDELVRPGEPIGPHQIVSSNALGLAAMIAACGGEAIDLGIAADDREELRAMALGARGADMLITLGGASVGDHDLVQSVLGEAGLKVDFWRIAMRPGKPLIFGQMGGTPMLGLPGNPVSSMVCGLLFVRPAIAELLGETGGGNYTGTAILGADMGPNDNRQDYVRASLSADGVATPFTVQDSAMLSSLAKAGCLIIRPPFAPAARAGDVVPVLLLEGD
ncbi:MAG: molybdopterin molybdenumtransferase MoeA [Alphaproteobacteria bacterium]|nr:molybdopterin molybdenumtransferase MoeA [Alphaproteobacteria bacterium]